MKITPYLEKLIWEGRAEYKTRMIGGATTWIQKIPKDNFIVVLGYQFQAQRENFITGTDATNLRNGLSFGATDNVGTYQVTILTRAKRLYNRIIQNPFNVSLLFDGTNYQAFLTQKTEEDNFYLIADDYLTIQLANWIAAAPAVAAQTSAAGIPQVSEIDSTNPGVNQSVTGIPTAGPQGLNPLGSIGKAAGITGTTEIVDELLISNAALAGKRESSNFTPATLLVHYVQCYFPKPNTI